VQLSRGLGARRCRIAAIRLRFVAALPGILTDVIKIFRIPGLARPDVLESELAARGLVVSSSDTDADDWHRHIKPNQIITLAMRRLERSQRHFAPARHPSGDGGGAARASPATQGQRPAWSAVDTLQTPIICDLRSHARLAARSATSSPCRCAGDTIVRFIALVTKRHGGTGLELIQMSLLVRCGCKRTDCRPFQIKRASKRTSIINNSDLRNARRGRPRSGSPNHETKPIEKASQ
jgi:hypothetical protein